MPPITSPAVTAPPREETAQRADSEAAAASTDRGERWQLALAKLFGRIAEVSALPDTASRVLNLAQRDDTRVVELYQAIQTDPALAMRVLRRVNSSYYGLRNKVADLNRAIGLLGFREIRNLVLTVYVARMFREPGDYRGYSRHGLWTHALGVAAVARLVSQVSLRGVPDEAYVAGLLHDVGFILLDQHLRRQFCRVLDGIDEETPTAEVERKVYTFDHAQLGGFVARNWSLPDQIADAIGHHHEPQGYGGEHKDLVYLVAIANYLCTRAGWPSLGVQNISLPPDEVYAGLGLDQGDLRAIWEDVPTALQRAMSLIEG